MSAPTVERAMTTRDLVREQLFAAALLCDLLPADADLAVTVDCKVYGYRLMVQLFDDDTAAALAERVGLIRLPDMVDRGSRHRHWSENGTMQARTLLTVVRPVTS